MKIKYKGSEDMAGNNIVKNQKIFYAIISGETDYLWWIKNQTSIEDTWNS